VDAVLGVAGLAGEPLELVPGGLGLILVLGREVGQGAVIGSIELTTTRSLDRG
jgi:hypothetical protein